MKKFGISLMVSLAAVLCVAGLLFLVAEPEAHADRSRLYQIVTGTEDQVTTPTMKISFDAAPPGKSSRTYNLSVDEINERISAIDTDITNLQTEKTFWEDCRTTVVAQLP